MTGVCFRVIESIQNRSPRCRFAAICLCYRVGALHVRRYLLATYG